MKLYHYITKGNSALTEGILSFVKNRRRLTIITNGADKPPMRALSTGLKAVLPAAVVPSGLFPNQSNGQTKAKTCSNLLLTTPIYSLLTFQS